MLIRAVRFIEGNGLVAYGVSEDGFLVSWEIGRATEKSVKLVSAEIVRYRSITFTPDYKLVVVFFENAGGRVWKTTTGDLKSTLVDSTGWL